MSAKGGILTGRVHIMSAGLGLCLRLGLGHHRGAERVHHSWLARPRGGLGNISRRTWRGARAARVKGRRAAMETSPISIASNTAVAQVHRQSLLSKEGGDVLDKEQRQTSLWNPKWVFLWNHYPRVAQVIHNSSRLPCPINSSVHCRIILFEWKEHIGWTLLFKELESWTMTFTNRGGGGQDDA